VTPGIALLPLNSELLLDPVHSDRVHFSLCWYVRATHVVLLQTAQTVGGSAVTDVVIFLLQVVVQAKRVRAAAPYELDELDLEGSHFSFWETEVPTNVFVLLRV